MYCARISGATFTADFSASEIEAKPGKRTDLEPSTGNGTRSQAATEAGLSKRQKDTALRVANIPKEEFEALVESDDPPTVTALAEIGKKSRPLVNLNGRDPEEYKLSTWCAGQIPA